MQTFPPNRHWKKPGASTVVVVCLLLLAIVSIVQVSHQHPSAAAADRCTFCVTMHSAAPVAVAAVAVVLVQLGVSAQVAVVLAPARRWQSKLFTRPPPRPW